MNAEEDDPRLDLVWRMLREADERDGVDRGTNPNSKRFVLARHLLEAIRAEDAT